MRQGEKVQSWMQVKQELELHHFIESNYEVVSWSHKMANFSGDLNLNFTNVSKLQTSLGQHIKSMYIL